MSVIIQAYGLTNLSGDQMRALGQALLDAAPDAPALPKIPESFREELRRRSADIDANPDDNIPWEQVRDESRARLKK